MSSIGKECEACGKYSRMDVSSSLVCPHCSKSWFEGEWHFDFSLCPFCQCADFYLQKDFNQALGCLMIAFAAVLVPWTYGLSLPAFWLLDRALQKRVSNIGVCYRCRTEFRRIPLPEKIKEFNHYVGIRHEKKT